MDEHHEREVALGLREGRPDAWRSLYDAFAERVWRAVARRLGPNAADVADVVQDTFLAAARSARAYDPERGPLWAWLWGIARVHVALHYRKVERREQVYLIRARRNACESNGQPADPLEAAELALLVRATLVDLPADYEVLLSAKYFDGDSVDAIAARERSTPVAVRSKLARARQAFREAFEKPVATRTIGTRP